METDNPTPDPQQRYCPICEHLMVEHTCPNDGVLTIPTAMTLGPVDLLEGTMVAGRYRIDGKLGAGGMAKVFRATQVSMQRPVALKVIQPALLHDVQAIKRFYREARAASQLSHPHIVNVHDFGVDDDNHTPFIAMELIEGENLDDILNAEGTLDERHACGLLAQVSRALVEAHAKGVVHRDLKPENIMVATHQDGTEHVTVLDFGIAKIARNSDDPSDSLTASGVALGTPRYMAPEQVYGEKVDLKADLYALGCILHELLTGKPPYEAQKAAHIMLMHVHEPIPELAPGIGSPGARALHGTLLRKRPEERNLSTYEVAQIFARLAAGEDALGAAMASTSAGQTFVGTETSDIVSAAVTARRRDSGYADTAQSPAMATDEAAMARPRLWLVVAPVILAVVAAVMAWRLSSRDIAAEAIAVEDSPPPATAAEAAETPASPATANTAASPAKAEPVRPTPARNAVPKATKVLVTSIPPGARILDGRKTLGRTPKVVSVFDAGRQVTLRLAGHQTETRMLRPSSAPKVQVKLRAKTKRSDDFPPLAPR